MLRLAISGKNNLFSFIWFDKFLHTFFLLDFNGYKVILCSKFDTFRREVKVIFFFSVARVVRPLAIPYCNRARIIQNDLKTFTTAQNIRGFCSTLGVTPSLVINKHILDISSKIAPVQVRTVTKFSLKRGKRKTVKAATKRFFRLHWGGWIRPKVGRQKKLWKKSAAQKRRLRQHVFCNATQSTLLDKMVTKFWKKPKHYVEDPYAPYHTREELYMTRKKPIVRGWKYYSKFSVLLTSGSICVCNFK